MKNIYFLYFFLCLLVRCNDLYTYNRGVQERSGAFRGVQGRSGVFRGIQGRSRAFRGVQGRSGVFMGGSRVIARGFPFSSAREARLNFQKPLKGFPRNYLRRFIRTLDPLRSAFAHRHTLINMIKTSCINCICGKTSCINCIRGKISCINCIRGKTSCINGRVIWNILYMYIW